jgi:hypothetical protein
MVTKCVEYIKEKNKNMNFYHLKTFEGFRRKI